MHCLSHFPFFPRVKVNLWQVYLERMCYIKFLTGQQFATAKIGHQVLHMYNNKAHFDCFRLTVAVTMWPKKSNKDTYTSFLPRRFFFCSFPVRKGRRTSWSYFSLICNFYHLLVVQELNTCWFQCLGDSWLQQLVKQFSDRYLHSCVHCINP